MPAAGISCAKVGEHLVSTMPAAARAKQDNLDKVAGALTQSCETDAWTEEAKSCLLAGQTDQALSACEDKLTAAQIQGMEKRTMDAMGANRAPPADAAAPTAPMMSRPPADPPPAPRGPSKQRPAKPGKTGGDPCDGSE